MTELLDKPTFIEDPKLDDYQIDGIPDEVYVIQVAEGKYVFMNITTPGPDPMTAEALCIFEKLMDVEFHKDNFPKPDGEPVKLKLSECVDIVKRKGKHALALQELGRTKHVHWLN